MAERHFSAELNEVLPMNELRDIVCPTRWLVNPSIQVVAGVRTVTT
jgi:hypothetical protein